MLAGELYIADDPDLAADYARCERALLRYNATTDRAEHAAILADLLDKVGEDVCVRPPFRIEYGYQTSIGARTFVNYGAVFLDVGKIVVGADVQIGPNVQLLTATHPIEPGPRRDKWESCEPITDRKSTRLNSSYMSISYAVFCLKKKNTRLNSSHMSDRKSVV